MAVTYCVASGKLLSVNHYFQVVQLAWKAIAEQSRNLAEPLFSLKAVTLSPLTG